MKLNQRKHQMSKDRNQKPFILSSKMILVLIIALCGWIIYVLSEERNVIRPKTLDFSLHLSSDQMDLNSKSQVIEIDEYTFHKQPVYLEVSDKNKLISMLDDKSLYYTPTTEILHQSTKENRDFHADYALIWTGHRLLFSFGSGEVRHYREDQLNQYDHVFIHRKEVMSLLRNFSLEAIEKEECLQSYQCKEFGRCKALNGRCVLTSDEDCTKLCKETGQCFANLLWGSCMVDTNEHCQQSTLCKESGLCTRVFFLDNLQSQCGEDQSTLEILWNGFIKPFIDEVKKMSS